MVVLFNLWYIYGYWLAIIQLRERCREQMSRKGFGFSFFLCGSFYLLKRIGEGGNFMLLFETCVLVVFIKYDMDIALRLCLRVWRGRFSEKKNEGASG